MFSKINFVSPFNQIEEYKKHSKLVMNRYANVQKIEEAEIVGILIGTVVCDNHMQIINQLKRSLLKQNKKFYEVLIGKINEPKLKNFQFIDLYVIIACPNMSLMPFKKFQMHVITPHEAMMALEPDLFPWESKIITDYNLVLDRFQQSEQVDLQKDILSHEFQNPEEHQLALISKQNQALIPIFSSQVIQRYEKFSYKGLEVDLAQSLKDSVDENGQKRFAKIEKGLVGIASQYEGRGDSEFDGKL